MRATIIVADNSIGINGEFKTVTLPDMGSISAVQWYEDNGHVEYSDYTNSDISSITDFMPILNLWGALPITPVLYLPITRADLPELSAWQVRKVLSANGLRDVAEAAVAASDISVQDAWKYATSYMRDNPILNAMAVQMNISQNQLDQMFIQGANL